MEAVPLGLIDDFNNSLSTLGASVNQGAGPDRRLGADGRDLG
jgi:hypothetical protein